MSPLLQTLARWLMIFADPRKVMTWGYLPRYLKHWRAYQDAANEPLKWSNSYPCLADWVAATPYDPHYFYQGAWLARRLAEAQPERHVDVGSSVLTMGVVSAHVPTVFVDYRPLNAQLPNLHSVAGTIFSLPFQTGAITSLSCMHVIEHIGLGRYGDPIDPMGAEKATRELSRVLAPGGKLYLTTPVGEARVCFNAHRVFSPGNLPALFPGLIVREFAWVDDQGTFHEDGQPADAEENRYACGFYVFEKPAHHI